MHRTFPRAGQAATLMSYPPVPDAAAGAVDPQLLAIQQDLYNTQFYKGRTDGRAGDEDRMKAAITLVQMSAGLPATGVYDEAVHRAITTFKTTGSWTGGSSSSSVPGPTAASSVVVNEVQRPWTKYILGATGFALGAALVWSVAKTMKTHAASEASRSSQSRSRSRARRSSR